MFDILLFFILQLVNVILSTMRQILTIKANKHISAIFSAISYTFYSGIVKMMTQQDMAVVLIATFSTNVIGVYLANFILDKLRKDKLWVFNATLKMNKANVLTVVKMLNSGEIKYLYNEVVKDELYSLQIFSYTQKESKMIREILTNYKVKYYITESKSA